MANSAGSCRVIVPAIQKCPTANTVPSLPLSHPPRAQHGLAAQAQIEICEPGARQPYKWRLQCAECRRRSRDGRGQ